jgi:predicted GTPase
MGLNENDVQHIIWNYDQLRNIVRPDSETGACMKQRLSRVENIIHKDLPELLKKVAPPNVLELTEDFNAEYDKFKDFIIYESLIGKNVVGLGGGFSSGKSSFLNALMGAGDILPVNINPSTSVPAYIVHGNENVVKAINIFDTCVELELEAINEIAYGFGAVGETDGQSTDAVQLGHILKNLFLETNLQQYENLVFLDTPGYTKPDSEDYSIKTDERIARQQLNTVDFILWFLPVSEAGSFTDSDIKFIKSLNQKIPITVICSKANRRTEQQRREIAAKVKEQILLENLNVKDVFFFDTESPDGLDSKKIYQLFSEWNKVNYEEEIFAKRFKRLFWECREYYKRKQDEASAEVRNLTNAMVLLEDEADIAVYIERVKANSEKDRAMMAQAGKEMLRLQTEFFKEIKVVADEVGIYMPEPKDIEVLEDKISNPLVVLQNYNKQHNKTSPTDMKEMISDAFRGIKPVFECEPGGSKYKGILSEMMEEIAFPKKEEIRFGSDINYSELLGEILTGTRITNGKLIEKRG